jgi:Arc/MetJ family transcription regulator
VKISLDKCIFIEYIYNAMKGESFKRTENMNTKKNILRFTVSMDKDLLDELLRITGQKKKSRAVNVACREFVRMKQKETLLSLKGNINFKGGENE